MFEEKKTLIVVYKDEMLVNLLRRCCSDNNDPVEIVAWTEKVWSQQKKAGNIQGKVLFIGNVLGVNNLLPIISVRYDKWGIKIGMSGNQAVIALTKMDFIQVIKGFYDEYVKYPILLQYSYNRDLINKVGDFALNWVRTFTRILAYPLARLAPDELAAASRDRYLFGVLEFYNNCFKEFMGIEEEQEDV